MSQSTNNEYRAPETLEGNAAPVRRGASPLLLVLLAVAVTAGALVWMGRDRQATPDMANMPAATPAAPVADAPRDRPAVVATTSKPRKAADRVAAINRPPRALAGNAEPKYPASVLRAGVGGTVVVLAELDAGGKPVNVRIAERSGERELDRAALSAVRQWRFEPALRNGKAVASNVRVPVDFRPADMVAAR